MENLTTGITETRAGVTDVKQGGYSYNTHFKIDFDN